MPSWYHRGAATLGVVRKKYRIDSGCAGNGDTLPPKRRLKNRSGLAAWSIATTCTSSWFMMMFIRSLPAIVSNAKLRGAICTVMAFLGTAVADAFPESSKSTSRTVMSSDGVKPNSRSWNASELRKVLTACGTRYDCVPSI